MSFSNNTRKYSETIQDGLDCANDITPSVLALARASGITAKKFAEAIHDIDGNSLYRIEVSAVLQKLLVDSAVAEAKRLKALEKSEDKG